MAEWIAIAVTLLGTLVAVVGTYSRLGARMDKAEERIREQDAKHDDHYKHAAKSDTHWTARERDDLNRSFERLDKRVDDMSADLKELLRRNGGPRG